ncbi:MAG: hypothetical protein CVV24_10985 [Ignavibacteriae bacterium HGW-Ignavibacteriae-3]|nr:MAG: hypothetical protein CVV24_10985 [Ignavibacteriae bacterium HGW-Ignavibacteriae-3]
MSKIVKNIKEQKKIDKAPFKDYWGKENYIFLVLSLVVLVIGYYVMTIGPWDSTLSMEVSPIILLIAYLILIPLTLFFKIPTKIKQKFNVPGKD